jgi:hypothetical protein
VAKIVSTHPASLATFAIDVIKGFYPSGGSVHGVTGLVLNQKIKPSHRMYVIIADANTATANS